MLTAAQAKSVRIVLLLVCVACLGYAWFQTAGWFDIEPGNIPAWALAGATFGFGSLLFKE